MRPSKQASSHDLQTLELSQTRKKYIELITSSKASVLITTHPTADLAFTIKVGRSNKSAGEDNGDDTDGEDAESATTEKHTCEVLCCKTPWSSTSTDIHTVKVTQAGLTIALCKIETPQATTSGRQGEEGAKAAPMPEDAATLSPDSVKLDIAA